MSSPRLPATIHISRTGWCVVFIAVLLPWILLVAFLTRSSPKLDVVKPLLTNQPSSGSFSSLAKQEQARPGPWGRLDFTRVMIEPPEEFVPDSIIAPREPRWIFPGYDASALDKLWEQAGLTATQRESLREPARLQITPHAVIVNPGVELILALSPQARAEIYTALAVFPDNFFQHDPYRIRADSLDDWFDESPVPADIIALTKRLTFRRGESAVFADPDVVLPRLSSTGERVRYIKTLSRKSALLVQLLLDHSSDIEALERYWGQGRRSKDLSPLLRSLAARTAGGKLDIVHLLPPFARLLLYTYPLPTDAPEQLAHDCHWTSFNFYRDRADERFTDINHVKEVLLNQYYPVGGAPAFGDIVMLVQAGNRAIHSCVYIADDIVFTKNGTAFSVPWLFGSLDSVVAFYSLGGPVEVRRYRAKPN